MPSSRQLAGKSLEEIADFSAGITMGSPNDQMAKTEFLLRQTLFQQQAAEAAIKTASETQRYTRYMFWSVVVLAVSSVLTFAVAIGSYLKDSSQPPPPTRQQKLPQG